VAPVGSQDEIMLVTDARGRLRYRVAAGEYRIRSEEGSEARFAVGGDRWTAVRLRLP
jgi:hypothetical protein